ncbi:MAG: ribosome maturation factor RimP [Gemmatimonadaceae bacterium]
MRSELETFLEQEVSALGYDLVEFRRGGTRSRPLLDVRIDRRDGVKVSLDDCAEVSREVEKRLDDLRLAGDDYVLEVSSPGVERPLRTLHDWRRFVGRRVRITSPAVNGALEIDLSDIDGIGDEAVAVGSDMKGIEHRVRIGDVSQARLVFSGFPRNR